MKIEIKFTADELHFLASQFNHVESMHALAFTNITRDKQVLLSICIDLADKICSAHKKLSRKTTLFDAKKRHKMSFKYHEAHALLVYLQSLQGLEIYHRAMSLRTISLLDEKLL